MQLELTNTLQQQQPTAPAPGDELRMEPPPSAATRLDAATGSKDAEAERKAADETKRSGGFVPFARDPLKQKRYEAYLEATKHNKPCGFESSCLRF